METMSMVASSLSPYPCPYCTHTNLSSYPFQKWLWGWPEPQTHWSLNGDISEACQNILQCFLVLCTVRKK